MCELVPIQTSDGSNVKVADIKAEVIKQIINIAHDCSKIDYIYIFGSSLEERCTDKSDIDIAIISNVTKSLAAVIAARQALDNYEKTKIKDIKNSASYNAQQAIEYILKYCIYNDSRYNGDSKDIHQIHTHDLDRLIRTYCIPYGIYVPKRIIKNAEIYSKWESESRYSLSYSVRADSVLVALAETEAWLVKLKLSYKAKIADVKKKLGIVVK